MKVKRKANFLGQGENKPVVTHRDRPGGAQRNAVVKVFTVAPFKRRDQLLKCGFRQ